MTRQYLQTRREVKYLNCRKTIAPSSYIRQSSSYPIDGRCLMAVKLGHSFFIDSKVLRRISIVQALEARAESSAMYRI
jgi:hypothetical protein